jgi:meso-butanediol dehydrogenase / (S,S)-butanediol dehydrogenase / diacetyl reductase
MADELGLSGALAVVTGGASGIGAACRLLLEASGAEVIVADRAADSPVDVTDRAKLDRLAGSLSRLDVLINAAGVLTENKPVDELPADDFRTNFEVNVLGTLNACQAFAGLLRSSRGAVVNVASQAALVSLPQQAAYSASKGAVAALTRSLAIDWAEHGVRVNAVAPGFTVTPMTEAFFENETFTRAATQRIPLGRLLQADEIAAAIVFLASPLASAITGVVLPVDGGWTAGEPALPW